ncbi:MAG: pentapeptide repeat-containing protein [Calothrix sp. MO_192.B10]|nr:pentapeptide repeat-containing protein [Calothrix sp. MO_192.B10]
MPPDFSGQNLRGQSFKGQDLSGAIFSGADIRGANFTGAILKDANFTHAKAGLQKRWATFLVVVSWLLSGLSGLLSSLIGYFASLVFSSDNGNQIAGLTVIIAIFIFFFITICQGIQAGAVALAGAGAVAFALAGAFALVFAQAGVKALLFAEAVTLAFALAFALVFALAFATVAGAFAFALATVARATVAKARTLVEAAYAVAFAQGGAAVAYRIAFAYAFAFAFAFALLSIYISWRAMKGEKKHAIIRNIAVAFAAFGGTSFRKANLTNANFTGAILKSTDFRKAILTRTCFCKAKNLDLVRPGNTYLKDAKVRQLFKQEQVKDKNFCSQNLRGVNLQKANLIDANFAGADLSQANLQDADLSRAILQQTQLDRTDFTGATLTGAYIEDWNITHETNFQGVRCDYVYMRLPTKENPNPLRKPDNNAEVFADGEFGDFIKPIVDTLDLYHNQGVDPRAIAISFKQLAEKNPDAELEIVAMERRGEDQFLLRAKTASEANKSELSAEYFEIYNHVKALAEQEVKTLLAEKDNRIVSLENMVNTALQRSHFYSSTQIQEVTNMTNNPGGFSVGGSVGGNASNVQGDNNRAIQGDKSKGVLGDGNQVTQQSQVNTETEASLTKDDVVALLTQLENLVQAAEVPEDTKETAIEDISAAKKATQKEEPKKNVALANLESVTQTLEKTSKTVDAGQKLWSKAKPIITKIAGWLGAAAGSYLLKL